MDATPPPARGPLRPAERAPAPDLARGFMLLLIALANTPLYLYGSRQSPLGAHPVDGTAADRAVQFVMILAVDGRVYPMFACLFGYGLMRIYDRQREAGASRREAAAVVRRRNLWLLVFGFVHAALLFLGDVLAAYGLLGLVLGGLLLGRGERAMRWTAAVLAGLALVLWVFSALGAALAALAPPGAVGGGEAEAGVSGILRSSFSEKDYLASVADRLAAWAFIAPLQALALVMPAMMALGLVLGRRRVLERPDRYFRPLVATAAAGIGLAWASALPEALAHVGAVPASGAVTAALSGVRQLSGVLGGAGYVALFALVGRAVGRRAHRGPGTAAVVAVGKRSLSCYLAQSVLCAPLLAAWGLGLGAHLGSAATALFAAGVWLATLVGAYALERAGRPGPAEALLRRLSYGPAARSGADGAQAGPTGGPTR
ncbi:DUF418 domain-containing protein [Streptomonospora wellingtoniae]|uniref:DUF418 domain-containing protein n=1 Tax=Streptomonospora wellingtoniae TaxID=3075544 RepID=A0ABU2KPI5_9ACTN|nr:DUF418 domain-containing protein [Streptomonospora sp. DSM 45055]MDT0301087.1 DUF418 domain-containing protein [Streptomonospora sp. DSM 45055]